MPSAGDDARSLRHLGDGLGGLNFADRKTLVRTGKIVSVFDRGYSRRRTDGLLTGQDFFLRTEKFFWVVQFLSMTHSLPIGAFSFLAFDWPSSSGFRSDE